MSVVLFGLFHGLVYLPVMLSLVGPSPYESSTKEITDSPEAIEMLPQPKEVQTNVDMKVSNSTVRFWSSISVTNK